VDGGSSPEKLSQALGQKLKFWDKSLDLVVLTHPHGDHLGGLMGVLQRYRVEQVLETDIDSDTAMYQEWESAVQDKDVKRTIAQVGQQIDLGDGIKLEVLYPNLSQPLTLKGENMDDEAMVLRLSWNEVSFLLTSDVGSDVERELLAQGQDIDSTVLKVGHHGSATSTSDLFLEAVNPEVAVISVGAQNDYNLPNDKVLARLDQRLGQDKVLLTSERGTIDILTDGQRLWVKTEK
jgi:competence protein ComEC